MLLVRWDRFTVFFKHRIKSVFVSDSSLGPEWEYFEITRGRCRNGPTTGSSLGREVGVTNYNSLVGGWSDVIINSETSTPWMGGRVVITPRRETTLTSDLPVGPETVGGPSLFRHGSEYGTVSSQFFFFRLILFSKFILDPSTSFYQPYLRKWQTGRPNLWFRIVDRHVSFRGSVFGC